MDNLESLKEEEQKLIKNKKITHAIWVFAWVVFWVILIFIDVGPVVIGIIGFLALATYLIWWRFDYKVKKIKEEISALEKE
jgi:Flp pilus assembly protein TadB